MRSYDKTFKLRKELFSFITFSLIITTNPNFQTANQVLLSLQSALGLNFKKTWNNLLVKDSDYYLSCLYSFDFSFLSHGPHLILAVERHGHK